MAQLKQLQSETEPIVKMFEDPETTRQMQSTRSEQPFKSLSFIHNCTDSVFVLTNLCVA